MILTKSVHRRAVASAFLAGLLVAAVCLPAGVAEAQAGRRVALQAGHWRAREAPFPLSISTGGSVRDMDEWRINLDVAQRAATVLRAAGIQVDVLPSWFPDDYAADAFLALHVNGSPNPGQRGFFADRAADSAIPAEEDRLVALINDAYGQATPIPYAYRPTPSSRRYYGFYRVTGRTPAALIELGFLTNEADRAFLTQSPQRAAEALAAALERFLADDRAERGGGGGVGHIRTAGGGPATFRARPTRRGAALAILPTGTAVTVTGRTTGEEVEPGNDRWVAVRWQGSSGYVYSGLVAEE
jgi:hypothetical protein